MNKEAIDFYRPKEPTGNEVLNALAGDEPCEDWCERILDQADPILVDDVTRILEKYSVFSEAEIAVEESLERG